MANNNELTIKSIDRTYAREVYAVYGDISAYTNEQLLNKCDRGNFGGRVYRYNDSAIAEVYTD